MNQLTPMVIDGLRDGRRVLAVSVSIGNLSSELCDRLKKSLLVKLRSFRPDITTRQADHQTERLLPPQHPNAIFEIWILLQDGKRFGPTAATRLDAFITGFMDGWNQRQRHAMLEKISG